MNLARIAQKIEEKGDKYSKFQINDMIRATCVVQKPEQLKEAYDILHKNDNFKIVKVKNNLTKPIQNVNLNLVYMDKINCEIQLRYGTKPANYYSNHFLYELVRADSLF